MIDLNKDVDDSGNNQYEQKNDRLTSYLLLNNLVDPVPLNAAQRESNVTHEDIGTILVRNGFISQKIYINSMIAVTDERLFKESLYLPHIPGHLLKSLGTKLVTQTPIEVFVSTVQDELNVKYSLKEYFPKQKITFIESSHKSIDEYHDEITRLSVDNDSDIDKLVRAGIENGASDIHIEPRDKTFTVFFRILGMREIVYEGPIDDYLAINSMIKDRSNMDIAERRIPLDGGYGMFYNGRPVDLRVATTPTKGGANYEKIVARILDSDNANKRLTDLGISWLREWQRGTSRANGLCLVCGETGSGKTTTLTSTIRGLDRFGKSIVTAEDPVEYGIPYVSQVEINEAVGLDFAAALKSFLRLDPDVIVIGEIRNLETARLAIKAAETGHLVFATLHTNGILSAINRFRDLDVPMHELRDVLRVVIAQKLVRTVCQSCFGEGCDICNHRKYVSRTTVSECKYFRKPEDFTQTAESRGVSWIEQMEDASIKAYDKITSPEEIHRIYGLEGSETYERISKALKEIDEACQDEMESDTEHLPIFDKYPVIGPERLSMLRDRHNAIALKGPEIE